VQRRLAVVARVFALRLGHLVSLPFSGPDAAYADCRKASAAIVGLFRLGALLGFGRPLFGAAARVDRAPAEAEFRAYIKAGFDCQYQKYSY